MTFTTAQKNRRVKYSALIAKADLATYFNLDWASAMALQTARDVMVADVIASIAPPSFFTLSAVPSLPLTQSRWM